MIHRNNNTTLLQQIEDHCQGGNPTDEWTFEYAGHKCRVVNSWDPTVASLYVDGVEVSRNTKMFSFTGRRPILAATLEDTNGESVQLTIHVRAIIKPKIQVRANNKPIHKGYL